MRVHKPNIAVSGGPLCKELDSKERALEPKDLVTFLLFDQTREKSGP